VDISLPKVTVLIAVFNGGCFLEEQLVSLVAQKGVDLEIHANDDGSTDGSYELLQLWKDKGIIAKLTQSNRIGASQSFFKLLKEVNTDSWVALCDQDDVWNKQKLCLQIEHMTTSESLMSSCSRIYIDSQGSFLGRSKNLRLRPEFSNALIENIAPGNTIVLHPAAVRLVNQFQNSSIVHYDSWIYLLISGVNHCTYLHIPLVSYRIHNNNLVGIRKFGSLSFLSTLKQYIFNAQILEKMAFDQLSHQNQEILREFNELTSNIPFNKFVYSLWKARFKRQSRLDQIVVVLLMSLLNLKGRFTSKKK
jgi:glycosyltransferase involved in cell wall biosynthesis